MKSLTVTLLATLLLAGCAAHQIHPGTANAFDSDAYDVLLIAHNVIESTKSDISAGSFPANILPGVKTALNGLITAYDALDVAYCNPQSSVLPTTGVATLQCSAGSYHVAAMAGTATAAQTAQIQAQVQSVNAAAASLTVAKAAK